MGILWHPNARRALEQCSTRARIFLPLEHFCGSVRALENFGAVFPLRDNPDRDRPCPWTTATNFLLVVFGYFKAFFFKTGRQEPKKRSAAVVYTEGRTKNHDHQKRQLKTTKFGQNELRIAISLLVIRFLKITMIYVFLLIIFFNTEKTLWAEMLLVELLEWKSVTTMAVARSSY